LECPAAQNIPGPVIFPGTAAGYSSPGRSAAVMGGTIHVRTNERFRNNTAEALMT
jgi:hypothetical protein